MIPPRRKIGTPWACKGCGGHGVVLKATSPTTRDLAFCETCGGSGRAKDAKEA